MRPQQNDYAAEVGMEGGFERVPRRSSKIVPTQVGRLFYAFGFLGATYPVAVIIFSGIVVLLSCYPLWSIPTSTSGNRPKEFITAFENYTPPSADERASEGPRWYKGSQAVFVQQILIKSFIHPWTTDRIITDAYRATLAESFQVVEVFKNDSYSKTEGTLNLAKYCFHVSDVKSKALKGKNAMLPEHSCLVVSPANFWHGNYEMFQDDPDILGTILNYRSNLRRRSGLAELLLGLNVRDTGLKRNPFKPRPRLVSYAVTLILQKYDPQFVERLEARLKSFYGSKMAFSHLPEEDGVGQNGTTWRAAIKDKKVVHIFYPAQVNVFQLMPLIATYITVFAYLYFSLKKVEMVYSKLGMAFTALTAIITSLCMSVGLSSHFGVAYQVNAQAIFPYVAVIIGLENLLVLLRSVVSTASHLDVKIRVAQGLSKEGWSIIKNLSAECTVLTVGFFTFIPQIQEFCILSIVGLLSDFFIQTFFFSTVLSIDIRRKERRRGAQNPASAFTPFRKPVHPRLDRVKSNTGLANGSALGHKRGGSLQVVAPSQLSPILVKIPKRLRVISFWARTRFFQRTFIICMVGWISCIIYESGIMHYNTQDLNLPDDVDVVIPNIVLDSSSTPKLPVSVSITQNASGRYINKTIFKADQIPKDTSLNESDAKSYNNRFMSELRDCNPNTWRRLSWYHWQVLLGIYNVSLTGKYISILPPICATITIDSREAISRRNIHEQEQAAKFSWQPAESAFEHIDTGDEYGSSHAGKPIEEEGFFYSFSALDDPYIPTTPIELALVVLLAIPSAIFMSYSLIVVYRCVCTRNYAEWRSSWSFGRDNAQDYYTQVVFEAVPLKLDGHKEEVECMGSDGNVLASVCLDGVLKVWNLNNGDNVVSVDRKRYFDEISGINENDSSNFFLGSEADSPIESSPPNANIAISADNLPEASSTVKRHHRQHTYSWSESEPPAPGTNTTPPLPQPTENGQQTLNQSTPSDSVARSSVTREVEVLHDIANMMGQDTARTSRTPPVPIQCSPPTLRRNHNGNSRSSLQGRNSESYIFNISEQHNSTHMRKSIQRRSNSRLDSSSEMIYEDSSFHDIPPIWCLECYENIVILGTGSGRIEFWDATTGYLKCTFDDENGVGVTCLKVAGNKIVAAKINGSVDFLQMESRPISRGGENSPYNRFPGHMSEGGENKLNSFGCESDLVCVWLSTQKAHQQPITCLDCDSTNIVTGSQDHCLKVFRVEDQLPFLSLHGHYGPITCVFIDKVSPLTLGSGSQDGLLCVWDLQTGMCMYSIQAHYGPISALTYSVSYIISAGGDDKICIWERFQGHLLNTIQLDHAYCSSLVMLTHNLLITSKQGSLVVWDVRSGEAVRIVRLGHRDSTVFVRQIMVCADAVLCDYGSQLRLVRFPSVISKVD